jgi:hypothetical protein
MTSIDGPLPDSSHLRQDINIPEEATLEQPDTSSEASTTSSLNAGQHAAGVSPVDAYQGNRDSPDQHAAAPVAEES